MVNLARLLSEGGDAFQLAVIIAAFRADELKMSARVVLSERVDEEWFFMGNVFGIVGARRARLQREMVGLGAGSVAVLAAGNIVLLVVSEPVVARMSVVACDLLFR